MRRNIRNCRSMRRAVILPLVAISLILLLGFVAFAVDLGYVYVSRAEMQRTADAAALAGASALTQGEDLAIDRAYAAAGLNAVACSPVVNDEVDVELGSWEWETHKFYPASWEHPVSPNAVRVAGSRLGMPLFFGPVLGSPTTDVVKDATALVGSGACAGVWGLEGITVHGDVYTDSYNSTEGHYGEGPIYPNGDLCSCQDLALQGGVDIHGDAMYGGGYNYTAPSSSHQVWGVVDTQECGSPAPGFDMEDAARDNDNGLIEKTDAGRDPFPHRPGELILIEDDNLTLTPGQYYFEAVKMTGQATLTITGPTTIYVSGSAKFTGGGLVNVTENPANLTVYSTGRDMDLAGGPEIYVTVIAPETDIKLTGTVDYYGAMLGKTVDMGGTFTIHVDEQVVQELFGIDATAPVLVE